MKSKGQRPSAFAPLLARAVELRRAGDRSGAAALCRSLLAADARNAQALHLLGTLALDAADLQGAREHLEAALRIAPRDAFVLVDLAQVHEKANESGDARHVLEKAVTHAGAAPGALLAAAAGFERLGVLSRAEPLYRRVTALAPSAVDAWIGLGNVQARSGQLDAAEASYRKATALAPDHPELFGNLANLASERGDVAGAEALLRRALDANPRNAIASHNLALLLLDAGKVEEAYTRFEAAMSLQPDFIEPALRFAALAADRGDLERAQAIFARITEAFPDRIDARYSQGLVLLALQRFEAARAHFERFAHEHPGAELAHGGLAGALTRLGKLEEAERAARAAVTCAPDSYEAQIDLIDILHEHGNSAEAEHFAAQLMATDPARAHAAMAAIHLGRGRAGAALPHFLEFARLDPSDSAARARIAEIRLLQGQPTPEAWADLGEWVRRARRIDAGAPGAPTPDTPLPDPDAVAATLLVEPEQGIGDELFFLRFAPGIAARGARILLRASPKLAPLLAASELGFVQIVASDTHSVPGATSVPITDLPRLADTASAHGFPAPIRLAVQPEHRARMRDRLDRLGPAPRIGVTWRGGTTAIELDWIARGIRALSKRIDPGLLGAALRDWPGTVLIVQRAPDPADVEAFRTQLGRDAHDLSDVNEDLQDMLALLALLDDYVGVSNTNMHLTASVGRTARVLVPCPPEWRWMEKGDESPWFPGFRVYRQSSIGDWTAALQALSRDLTAVFPPSAPPARSAVTDSPSEVHSSTAPAPPANASALISEEYRRMQQALHADPEYGVASVEFAPMVASFIQDQDVKALLDYGAGKGRLGQELAKLLPSPPAIRHYDPGVPAWSARPEPAELVTCIDVLEHIEPDLLSNVLDDLARVTVRFGIFTIATGPARKVLADGRNAHLIQQPPDWWLPQLMQRFELVHFSLIPRGFLVIVRPKAR